MSCRYYRLIHHIYPLLPHDKQRLRVRLGYCPTSLREAFLIALDTLIRTIPASNVSSNGDFAKAIKRAADLLSSSQFETAPNRSVSDNTIYIQTLVLLALQSDNHGPATLRGQIGPPRAEWIGRAVGMATHLKLNMSQPRDKLGQGEIESDERIGRRVWWILFILDRWHASSTSTLLQIPDHSSSLVPEDQVILGETTYHLARKCTKSGCSFRI